MIDDKEHLDSIEKDKLEIQEFFKELVESIEQETEDTEKK